MRVWSLFGSDIIQDRSEATFFVETRPEVELSILKAHTATKRRDLLLHPSVLLALKGN